MEHSPSPVIPHDPPHQRLTAAWLLVGVGALALSGLFSVLLVLARTPTIQQHIPFKDFFHTALVVHVDLSVLVWFLANACLLWQITAPRLPLIWHRLALLSFAAGTLLLGLSPFLEEGTPLMNNYVPVLLNRPFFAGLVLIALGVAMQAASMLFLRRMWTVAKQEIHVWGAYTAAIIALLSIGFCLLTLARMPHFLEGESYFEVLFWAGGHTLQFGHTQLLIVIWVWLAGVIGLRRLLPERVTLLLLTIGLLATLAGMLAFFNYPLESYEFRRFFTLQMIFLGGIYVAPVGIALLMRLWNSRSIPLNEASHSPVRHCLWASVLLFGLGGLIALTITEIDVTIPAHYHGSIVGISLAFMGLHYYLLPQLGYAPVTGRLASIQPWLYGGGQALHITGLLISGGYDVARKSTESYEGITGAQIGMGLMGLGGLLAILGGLAFVVVVVRSCLKAT